MIAKIKNNGKDKNAEVLLEEAILEAGASGQFLAGGTQKLELLGFLRWRCPEIRISWAFCWRWIQKLELLGVAPYDGIQKLELLDMFLALRGIQKLELLRFR